MSKLFLIRHGQASLGKQNYDMLSKLGEKQSELLGEHLKDMGVIPNLVIRGDMHRHFQTSAGMLEGLSMKEALVNVRVDPRWNEFDFETLIRAYLAELKGDKPTLDNPKAFFSLLKNALTAWSRDEIQSTLAENWQDFSARINDALLAALQHHTHANIFVVSSGGAISMALSHLLKFDAPSIINLNLQSRNSGISEIYFNEQQHYVTSFNGVPHLERGNRKQLITSA
jgi:broad specificity phosphatase PhoE